MPPRTLAGDDCPIIIDEGNKDIKRIGTSTDVSKVAEDGGTFLNDGGILPVDHD